MIPTFYYWTHCDETVFVSHTLLKQIAVIFTKMSRFLLWDWAVSDKNPVTLRLICGESRVDISETHTQYVLFTPLNNDEQKEYCSSPVETKGRETWEPTDLMECT